LGKLWVLCADGKALSTQQEEKRMTTVSKTRVMKFLAWFLFAFALTLPLWESRPTASQSQTANLNHVASEVPDGTLAAAAPATEALTTDMDAKTDDLFNNFGARAHQSMNALQTQCLRPRAATEDSRTTSSSSKKKKPLPMD
jgi:hypothetical protein